MSTRHDLTGTTADIESLRNIWRASTPPNAKPDVVKIKFEFWLHYLVEQASKRRGWRWYPLSSCAVAPAERILVVDELLRITAHVSPWKTPRALVKPTLLEPPVR